VEFASELTPPLAAAAGECILDRPSPAGAKVV